MKGQRKDKPCCGCTERTAVCHGSCRAYAEAVATQEEKRAAARREKRGNEDYIETKRQAVQRSVQQAWHGKRRR